MFFILYKGGGMNSDVVLIESEEYLSDLIIATHPDKVLLIIMERHLFKVSSGKPIALVYGDYVHFYEDLPDPVANLIGDEVLFYKQSI